MEVVKDSAYWEAQHTALVAAQAALKEEAKAEIATARAETDKARAETDKARAETDKARAETAAGNKEIAARDKQAARCSLRAFRQKWPRLIDNTDTTAHSSPKNHAAADRREHTVDWDSLTVPEAVWSTPAFACVPTMDKYRMQGENSVVNYLVVILDAVIRGLGMEGSLKVLYERVVAGIECDIILAYGSNLIPLGVIEVKKPHGKKDDDKIFAAEKNRVAGQNFNQLRNLSMMAGLQKVYGIITNGNMFMLTSTHPIPKECPSTEKQNIVGTSNISPERVDVSWALGDSDGSSGSSGDADSDRIIHTSQLLDTGIDGATNSENVIKMLVSFVMYSYNQISLVDLKKPIGGELFVRKLVAPANGRPPNDFKHAFTKIQTGKTLNQSDYITPSTKNIYLVRYLGSGGSGDCCFAVSETGKTCCAVKFFTVASESEELAKNELKNWNYVYGGSKLPKCRIGYVAPHQAYLVMPYLSPVIANNRKSLLGDISTALKEFSLKKTNGKRYLHDDVKWRHFGYYKGNLYLMDLEAILEVKDGDDDAEEEEVSKWIRESLKSLEATMAEASANQPASAGSKRKHGN
jgi:hypothetical protein